MASPPVKLQDVALLPPLSSPTAASDEIARRNRRVGPMFGLAWILDRFKAAAAVKHLHLAHEAQGKLQFPDWRSRGGGVPVGVSLQLEWSFSSQLS